MQHKHSITVSKSFVQVVQQKAECSYGICDRRVHHYDHHHHHPLNITVSNPRTHGASYLAFIGYNRLRSQHAPHLNGDSLLQGYSFISEWNNTKSNQVFCKEVSEWALSVFQNAVAFLKPFSGAHECNTFIHSVMCFCLLLLLVVISVLYTQTHLENHSLTHHTACNTDELRKQNWY